MSAKQGRTPRRPELAQHFLRSEALASRLAAQTHISRHDLVVEIGPGRGALTAALARRCRKLIAVELDSRLCGLLREQFRDRRHVSIVQGDFLRFRPPTAPYKVMGSIPFSRTAAIVRRLVGGPASLTDAYLVTQREAAHRFARAPYAPESLPSLLLKPDWQVEIVHRLRRTDFDPPPSRHGGPVARATDPAPCTQSRVDVLHALRRIVLRAGRQHDPQMPSIDLHSARGPEAQYRPALFGGRTPRLISPSISGSGRTDSTHSEPSDDHLGEKNLNRHCYSVGCLR